MYDCSKLIADFHADYVRLTNSQRADMKSRREANLKRIHSGLSENDKADVVEEINQGGYAMKTMTQPPEGSRSSYDIDLGVVFEGDAAAAPRTTRGWILDALAAKANNVKGDPEDTGKCIRIEYSEGYQCDFPVFKREPNFDSYTHYFACRDEWVLSSPQQINDWFEREVSGRSPESTSPYQLRRIVRLLKYLGKVWSEATGTRYPSGLLLTALAVECYSAYGGRLDQALYLTLRALSSRYAGLPVHADGIVISNDSDTARIERLRKKAEELVEVLKPLADDPSANDDVSARARWKKVFRHSFFDPIETKSAKTESSTTGRGALGLAAAVFTERAAAAVQATAEPTRPYGGRN